MANCRLVGKKPHNFPYRMRLYHFLEHIGIFIYIGVSCIFLLLLSSCTVNPSTADQITIKIESVTDGSLMTPQTIQMPLGSTVQEALERANISLGILDRVIPPLYNEVSKDMRVQIIRRREEFEQKKNLLPFEKQIVKNLNLPEGEMMLIQAGENGVEEITLRIIFENGKEISEQVVKSVIIEEAVPEIVMVGSQQPFTTLPIPGHIAYISGGNAWVMVESTAERRPLIINGKLDGRVFLLSPDGEWLLYTQKADEEGQINTLWAIKTDGSSEKPLNLEAKNIVHFASWLPNSKLRIAFSTVEPRSTPPGWQANNDLFFLDFSENGWISKKNEVLSAQVGGVYGWWGTMFTWAPDGSQLAYSRADQIGLVSITEKNLIPLLDSNPVQTYGDWAWITYLSWSPDSKLLYFVEHHKQGEQDTEGTSPNFDIAAIPSSAIPVSLISQTGMFAYPSPSPFIREESGENGYMIAYLQAITPEQSQNSRYQLYVADRDGSDKQLLFPQEGMPGVEPQNIVWSPQPIYGKITMQETQTSSQTTEHALTIIYQGDIWLIEVKSGKARQITADGLVSKIDWK